MRHIAYSDLGTSLLGVSVSLVTCEMRIKLDLLTHINVLLNETLSKKLISKLVPQ